MLSALTLLAVSLAAPSSANALALQSPPADAAGLVRDAITLQRRVFEDLERHCFLQRISKERPGAESRSRREERLEEVCFRQGTPVYKVLTINGKPTGNKAGDPFPPPANLNDWRKRVERAQERRKRDQELLEQVMQAFRFQAVGESVLEGRPVVVVDMAPRPEFQPTSRTMEMLKHVKGRMWIDRQTHHVMMLQAVVDSDFSIWGGLVAKVYHGATFELRQKPFNGTWFPYFLDTRWEARVALVKNIGEHERLERSDFRRLGQAGAADADPE